MTRRDVTVGGALVPEGPDVTVGGAFCALGPSCHCGRGLSVLISLWAELEGSVVAMGWA